MTLGEKIRAARKNAGLTQEQLAEMLTVSRPAVTKWEADKGIPDIENLKAMSKLLNVSIDYLLNDGEEELDLFVIKEPIDLSLRGREGKKAYKDKLVRERYRDAEIFDIYGEKLLTKGERVIDNIIGWFTDAPFGTPELINSVKLASTAFYLVNDGEKQYLLTVTNDFMEARALCRRVPSERKSRFRIGEMKYTVLGKIKE